MKRKYLMIGVSAIMLSSLVGCGSNEKPSTSSQTETTESSESVNSEESSTDDTGETTSGTGETEGETSETESESIIDAETGSEEFVAIVDSITDDGFYFHPYDKDSNLWQYGQTFYISSENVTVFKNDKSSIYDIVYFYDGFKIKFNGTYDEYSSYTELSPEKDSKINIYLTDEYKVIEDETTEEEINEDPVKINNSEDTIAKEDYTGLFCKFSIPGKYRGKYKIDNEKLKATSTTTLRFYLAGITEKDLFLFQLQRIPVTSGKGVSKYPVEGNDVGIALGTSDKYIYDIKYAKDYEEHMDDAKAIIEMIKSTIQYIE